jgi:hypothetical protein
MKFRKLLFTTLTVCATLISTLAFAQFEGQITMKVYGEDEAGNDADTELNLYTTKDRIILKGEDAIQVSEGLDASGLLIRNDKRDFVIMMGENQALQFTRDELAGAFRMIGMMDGSDDNDVDIESSTDFEYTNRTRTINGYETTELLITDKEKEGSISIWLTSKIDINWGMLEEPWTDVPESMRKSVNRVSQEFKSKNFPMMIEVTDKDGKEVIYEVTGVVPSSIGKAMVEIPSGVNLVGLNEFLFSMMMGN